MSLRRIIILNLRWHRRIGLSLVLFVLFLTVTGVLLNHSPSLALSKTQLKPQWLLSWYGLEPADTTGFSIDKRWLFLLDGAQLYLDNQPVTDCRAPLLGAASYSDMLLALCADALVVLSPTGELVEKLSHAQGLPTGANGLQVVEDQILINTNKQPLWLKIDSLKTGVAKDQDIVWSTAAPLPSELAAEIMTEGNAPGVSLETVLLDLHSGRFFGSAGVFFVDLIGLLLAVLALTGLWSWYSHNRLRRMGG